MALANLTDLQECPHCGYDEFYTYQTVKGKISYRERFDGEDGDNAEMYNSLSYGKQQKTVYCGSCQSKIARDDREEKKEFWGGKHLDDMPDYSNRNIGE